MFFRSPVKSCVVLSKHHPVHFKVVLVWQSIVGDLTKTKLISSSKQVAGSFFVFFLVKIGFQVQIRV